MRIHHLNQNILRIRVRLLIIASHELASTGTALGKSGGVVTYPSVTLRLKISLENRLALGILCLHKDRTNLDIACLAHVPGSSTCGGHTSFAPPQLCSCSCFVLALPSSAPSCHGDYGEPGMSFTYPGTESVIDAQGGQTNQLCFPLINSNGI